jgi:hypothetical protein
MLSQRWSPLFHQRLIFRTRHKSMLADFGWTGCDGIGFVAVPLWVILWVP